MKKILFLLLSMALLGGITSCVNEPAIDPDTRAIGRFPITVATPFELRPAYAGFTDEGGTIKVGIVGGYTGTVPPYVAGKYRIVSQPEWITDITEEEGGILSYLDDVRSTPNSGFPLWMDRYYKITARPNTDNIMRSGDIVLEPILSSAINPRYVIPVTQYANSATGMAPFMAFDDLRRSYSNQAQTITVTATSTAPIDRFQVFTVPGWMTYDGVVGQIVPFDGELPLVFTMTANGKLNNIRHGDVILSYYVGSKMYYQAIPVYQAAGGRPVVTE